MTRSFPAHPFFARQLRPAAILYLIPAIVLISFSVILVQTAQLAGMGAIFMTDEWGLTPLGEIIARHFVPFVLVIIASVPVILTIDIFQQRDHPLQERRAANLASQKLAAVQRRTRPLELVGEDLKP